MRGGRFSLMLWTVGNDDDMYPCAIPVNGNANGAGYIYIYILSGCGRGLEVLPRFGIWSAL